MVYKTYLSGLTRFKSNTHSLHLPLFTMYIRIYFDMLVQYFLVSLPQFFAIFLIWYLFSALSIRDYTTTQICIWIDERHFFYCFHWFHVFEMNSLFPTLNLLTFFFCFQNKKFIYLWSTEIFLFNKRFCSVRTLYIFIFITDIKFQCVI